MDFEVDAMISQGTWTLKAHLDDINIVICKWAFILKYKLDGSVSCHKAHLVPRGCT